MPHGMHIACPHTLTLLKAHRRQNIPTRRAQSILWGISTTAMAGVLLTSSPLLRELGAIWLVAVAMNLISALVLAFSDAARSPGE